MRQVNIKKQLIADVLNECGYFEIPNGWVKYIDGARYNLERFHYKDGKLHLDGIKNGMHVVRKDMRKGSIEKYLMDNEMENIENAKSEIAKSKKKTDAQKRNDWVQGRVKMKIAYAPNIKELQKQILNPPKKTNWWLRFVLWITRQ